MDIQRAKEIAASPVMAHVSHNGTQIYIQGVDDESQTAHIYHLKNPDQKHSVHVNELEERGPLQ